MFFLVSLFSLMIPMFNLNGPIIYFAFLIFECCVGMFWPSVGRLRATYIPEQVRATIMNYFRIPTNVFVLLILNKVNSLPIFFICSALLLISLISQILLDKYADLVKKDNLNIDEENAISIQLNNENSEELSTTISKKQELTEENNSTN